ncbi:MAG: hypothetical protein A2Z72_00340 [Omnitrophica bacterium RBG_13_46_9]|nr:MAG: hypothetical protein A2Z72_00340 [Omnitrophica bacterium RBG_13_46_9]
MWYFHNDIILDYLFIGKPDLQKILFFCSAFGQRVRLPLDFSLPTRFPPVRFYPFIKQLWNIIICHQETCVNVKPGARMTKTPLEAIPGLGITGAL